MGIIFVSLIYTLPALLFCIAGLAFAFHCWRRHQILHAAINFKRPYWLAIFVSLAIVAVGVLVSLFGLLWAFLDDHYFHSHEKMGPDFIFTVLGIIIAGFGAFCLWLSSVCCLWRLLSALLSHVHSLHSNRAA
jgi:hypothetical protein